MKNKFPMPHSGLVISNSLPSSSVEKHSTPRTVPSFARNPISSNQHSKPGDRATTKPLPREVGRLCHGARQSSSHRLPLSQELNPSTVPQPVGRHCRGSPEPKFGWTPTTGRLGCESLASPLSNGKDASSSLAPPHPTHNDHVAGRCAGCCATNNSLLPSLQPSLHSCHGSFKVITFMPCSDFDASFCLSCIAAKSTPLPQLMSKPATLPKVPFGSGTDGQLGCMSKTRRIWCLRHNCMSS